MRDSPVRRTARAARPAPPIWLTEVGPDSDVVLATRCRLARNLADMPFPWRAAPAQRREVAEAVLEAAQRSGGILSRALALRREELDAEQQARLIEWRYASHDWMREGTHRWLLIAPERHTSLLVNEEDHIRLQTILPGLQVEWVLKGAEQAERELSSRLHFAWEERIGFLTAALTNAGTGLRISVLLHLAGLAASGAREETLEAAAQVGCAVRGLYGEGTRGAGELYQVSNTLTYGRDAERVAERVEATARYLIAAERRARAACFQGREGRARLVAATADALRCLFQEEAAPRRMLPLVSVLRLAVAEGVLPGSLAECAGWVALAGVEAATPTAPERAAERYEAVRRSAVLRQRLRALVGDRRNFPADVYGITTEEAIS